MWKNLGEGYASIVYHAFCKTTRVPVAIKAYKKSRLSRLNDYQVRREVSMHASLTHPHIINLYCAFEDKNAYYLVQELAGKGDLFVTVKNKKMTEEEVVRVMVPVMESLLHLHEQGIIHRDLKPENIFMSAAGMPKLGDFGLAICVHDERPVTRVGTLDYMAPEILLCHTKDKAEDFKDDPVATYTANVDCWATGVLAYELLTGRPPFRGQNRQQVSQAIMTQQPKYPVWASSTAVDFMTKVLTKSAAKRPTMRQLLEHPWVTHHMDEDTWHRIHGTGTVPQFHEVAEPAGVERSNPSVMVKDPNAALPPHRMANPGRQTSVTAGQAMPTRPQSFTTALNRTPPSMTAGTGARAGTSQSPHVASAQPGTRGGVAQSFSINQGGPKPSRLGGMQGIQEEPGKAKKGLISRLKTAFTRKKNDSTTSAEDQLEEDIRDLHLGYGGGLGSKTVAQRHMQGHK